MAAERHSRLLERLDQETCSRETLRKTCPNQVLPVRSAIHEQPPVRRLLPAPSRSKQTPRRQKRDFFTRISLDAPKFEPNTNLFLVRSSGYF